MMKNIIATIAGLAAISTGSAALAQERKDPHLTRAAIARFLGARRDNVMYADAPLTKQLARAINGPQSDYVRLPDGGLLIGACRAGSCGEKAAVIMDPNGEIVGAALLGFRCTDDGCANEPVAVAYIRRNLVDGYPRDLLRSWTSKAFDNSTNMDGTPSVAKDLHIVAM